MSGKHNEEGEGDFSYLIKGMDADPKHNSWHHQSDLSGCERLIKEYWVSRGGSHAGPARPIWDRSFTVTIATRTEPQKIECPT